jgi:1-acyl-sn-glycerol-3-phosphate acyltransferase
VEENKAEKEKAEEKKDKLLRRHRWLWKHVLPRLQFFLRLRYGPFDFAPAPELEGSYIVLPNHSCGADQFFVAFSFLKRHMYYVASEHAFRKKLLGAVMRFATGPISRVKGTVAASTVLSILRWLRQGVPICIFPEGNRTWNGRSLPLHPTTAKLLRTSGVPVMTYRIEGGYLSDPRWSHSLRRGVLRGGVVNVYRPEELKKMSLAEINERISADLWVDTDESQSREHIPYRGRRRAEGLEEALFLCPKCGRIGTLRGKGNVFSCVCGLRAEYGEDGFFDAGAPFRSVAAWDDWQQSELRRRAEEGDIRFSDEGAEIWQLGEDHKMTLLGKGTVALDRDSLRLEGLRFPLEGMQEPELCHLAGKETMMFTNAEGSFELRFKGSPSRRKYQLLIRDFLALGQETAGN